MPRAPCCDQKLGLKKGPWTRDEDQILINYVQNYGHANWRALPKQAGLLRCGKSCRLRWINYLRPDIKRGNFSPEEEDAIIHLHQTIGNRWSAIAARLPGRTDNEIKNVWHTHLKKRVIKNKSQRHIKSESEASHDQEEDSTKAVKDSDGSNATSAQSSSANYESDATQQSPTTSSSEHSSTMFMDMLEPNFPEIDDSFWTDNETIVAEPLFDDGMDFWYNVLLQAEDDLSLPQC